MTRRWPLPYSKVTPQLFRKAAAYALVQAEDRGPSCSVTSAMVDSIACGRLVPPGQVVDRLSPDEICFLYLYEETIQQARQTGTDWEPWEHPMAWVRFVLMIEKRLRWACMPAMALRELARWRGLNCQFKHELIPEI